jgi:integrase
VDTAQSQEGIFLFGSLIGRGEYGLYGRLYLQFVNVIQDGHVLIARSLSQTKAGLKFKGTKTGRQRLITLPPSAIAALENHRRQQDVFRDQFGPDYQGNLIFANPDGTPLKPDSISSTVSLLFRRLKLPKHASLHSLRHTHGSHLLATGTSLPAVSKRLGHSSPYVTATIYAHAIDGQDEEAARKWDEFQKRSTSPVKRV